MNIFLVSEIIKCFRLSETCHVINLVKKMKLLYFFIYNFSAKKLIILWKYLKNSLQKNWICSIKSSTEASMLFSFKKDERLKLYVNYKELNKIIIKNHYFLSLINEMLNQLVRVKIYSKIDFCNIYHKIKIQKDDEWKTVFCT